jgi:LPS export ABC transporter protein LptC
MRWQRPVRLVLGLFALVFAVVVYLQIDKREPAGKDGAQTRTDPDAVIESTKGQSFFFKSAKQDIRIDYERLLTYQSGRSKFFGAKVAILDRAGRNFEILANEAEVAEGQSQIDLRGAVVLTTSDKLTVKTENAVYTQSDEVVRVPGPVAFSRERMQGTSVGASYDRARDVLWLLDQARITVAPDPQGQGGVVVTAGAAGYARRDRYIRFERTVHLVRGGQAVDADGAVAYLKPQSDELEMIELRGHSRVSGIGTGANGLQAMTARDINLRYQADGQTIEQATLIGESVLQLAGGDGKPGQRLSAQSIDIELAPDGQTVETLSGQDNVQLDLPAAQPGGSVRQIRCVSLEASGEPGKPGLQKARFSDKVEFRETQPATKTAAAVQRVVKSQVLDTKLESGLSAIDEATFTGGVTVQDGPRTASGPSMLYSVTKGAIALFGPPDAERTFVQVTDERVNIEARRLDWTVDGTRMVADVNVKSVLKPQPPGGADAGAVKRPSMFAGDQPVNVTAKHLVYNRETGRAEYTGESQLWQGQTSIKADNITLDEASGNLAASGSVRSVMRMESTEASAARAKSAQGQPSPAAAAAASATRGAEKPGAASPTGGGKSSDTRPAADTIATADDLVYDDGQRKAVYTKAARVFGESGDLRGERIELFFDQSGKGLERLEAYEKVRFKLAARGANAPRWGRGGRLSYFAADERYVLAGGPAHVVEQLPGDCRQTTGRTLTFFKATDSVLVDSNAQGRTQTRTGGACPEMVP